MGDIFKECGCKLRAAKAAEGEAAHKVATLQVPLTFPLKRGRAP